jgi:hypothetical protein
MVNRSSQMEIVRSQPISRSFVTPSRHGGIVPTTLRITLRPSSVTFDMTEIDLCRSMQREEWEVLEVRPFALFANIPKLSALSRYTQNVLRVTWPMESLSWKYVLNLESRGR